MSVLYKFKNLIKYDAVKVDGVDISASDLKASIVQQKKLGHSELQLMDEQSGHIYKDDESIPRNKHVIVSRLPFANPNKRPRLTANNQNNSHHYNSNNNSHHHHNHHHNNHSSNNGQSAGASSSSIDHHGSANAGREALELVSTANMSEEEKLKCVQSQSTRDFDPTRYARGRGGYRGAGGRGGGHRHFVPGPGYTCRKCGIPGHSIYDCKISSVHKVKRSSGIPREFLIKVDSKEKGALMTQTGEYVIPYIDREAYNNPKVEKAPFFEDASPSADVATKTTPTTTTR